MSTSRKLAVALLLLPVLGRGTPQVLRVCDDVAEPATLNPFKEFSEKYYTIIQQIFDSLVRFDPKGRIEPALATAWKRIDELTLDMELRRGVRFHNGEPFTARSACFSIERLLDPQTGFPGTGMLDSIAKVEALDDHTLRIRTKYPDGILLNRLASLVAIVPELYIKEKGERYFDRHPVGTGAFRFASWEQKQRIILERNPDYWMPGYPKFEGLEFHFLPTALQVSALINGKLDIVTELPGTATLRVMKSGSADIVKKESFYTVGGSINISSGPLADPRVRRALNHAINREQLVRYDLLGNGKPLASLTMPGEIGHDPSLTPYAYAPRLARRLLAEAGYPKGLTLKAVVKAQGERTMRIIAHQLSRVGIRIVQTQTTDADVIKDIQRGGWDFTFGGCPDPLAHSFFVQFIFLSSLSPYSILRDSHLDALMLRMTTALDAAEQNRIGQELDRYVYDQALSVFTYQRIRTYGVSKRVHFVPYVTGIPYFHTSSPL